MRRRLLGVIILGASLVISSIVFGNYFYQSRQPEKTIRVVGAATKRFGSDIIKWRLTLSRSTGLNDLAKGYNKMKTDLEVLIAFLKANGVAEKDISVQPINTNPIYQQYDRPGSPNGYNITQNIYLISQEVEKVEKMALDPSALIEKGVIIQSSSLEFYSSELNDLKKQLLAEATVDARKRAEEIAKSSNDKINYIVSARVGVFQITEPFSTEVSDYGIYNTSTKEKDITVTVNVVFNLK